MLPAYSSLKPLLSLSTLSTRHDQPEGEAEVQASSSAGQISLASLPVFSQLPFHPFRTPFTPPLTPPALTPSTSCELDSQSVPFTPSTPIFSPISDQDGGNSFDASYARPTHPGDYKLDSKPNPSTVAPHDVSSRSLSPGSPRMTYVSTRPHPISPMITFTQPNFTQHLFYTARLDQNKCAAAPIVTNAQLYSAHFPPGHAIDAKFAMEYTPGAEIGVGGFGFVVTVTHRVHEHEVAVKFIERKKVPAWGWCKDPVLGNVPTEVMLLRVLDHPGIIKFLDFFQDESYFYLVQELHGSPWGRKGVTRTNGLNKHMQLGSVPPVQFPSVPGTAQSPEHYRHRRSQNSYPGVQSSPSEPTGSPSTHSSSPNSSSMFPSLVLEARLPTFRTSSSPNINRTYSHDLFECIEEHKRLSESQARYIFAQVVDVVRYLDSVGIAHRDIKDENILIDRALRIKIIDFGSASITSSNRCGPRPLYGQFRGTIAYAPAEIFRGVKMHKAEPADVWALGILLSCLICGRRPFTTAEDAAKGRFMLHGCKVRAKGVRSESHNRTEDTVSAECWDLLKRCLDPDPDTRAQISEVAAHPWLQGALDTACIERLLNSYG